MHKFTLEAERAEWRTIQRGERTNEMNGTIPDAMMNGFRLTAYRINSRWRGVAFPDYANHPELIRQAPIVSPSFMCEQSARAEIETGVDEAMHRETPTYGTPDDERFLREYNAFARFARQIREIIAPTNKAAGHKEWLIEFTFAATVARTFGRDPEDPALADPEASLEWWMEPASLFPAHQEGTPASLFLWYEDEDAEAWADTCRAVNAARPTDGRDIW